MIDIIQDGLIVNNDISIVEAMKKINQNALGILFVKDNMNKLVGSVSDGDIRRWIISTGDISARIELVMNVSPKYVHFTREGEAHSILDKEKIHILPVVNDNMEIIDIISDEFYDIRRKKKQDLKGVPVVIMAGGKGTRLQPYTTVLPKPLIPIGDVPIVQRIINNFTSYGIDDFYLTVNYKSGIIKAFFDDLKPSYSVSLVEENIPLGTAGSIKLVENKLTSPFIVSNCDILIDCDYSKLYEYHMKSNNMLTVVAAVKDVSIPYGVFTTDGNGRIESIEEKPKLSYLVNTGMYIVNPEAIRYIPEGEFFHMTGLIDSLIKSGCNTGIFPVSEDSFMDMGQFDEMKNMNEVLSRLQIK